MAMHWRRRPKMSHAQAPQILYHEGLVFNAGADGFIYEDPFGPRPNATAAVPNKKQMGIVGAPVYDVLPAYPQLALPGVQSGSIALQPLIDQDTYNTDIQNAQTTQVDY